MFNNVTISDMERKTFPQWTALDEDLAETDPDLAETVLRSRLDFARGDLSRTAYWHDPEEVDVFEDMQYVDDGTRAHRLDLYLPHDSAVRGGKTTPVYIDIHGGGFVYGYKELNRNFCTNLAKLGFAVFSVNYRPAPKTDFLGQLEDVAAAFRWIREHRNEYPISQNNVFLTGDSAGGTLALYMTAIERSGKFADAIGVGQSGLTVAGSALVSPLTDLAPYLALCEPGTRKTIEESKETSIVEHIAPTFFAKLHAKKTELTDLATMAEEVDFPPILINTSSDDFIHVESLKLATALVAAGRDVELHDWHTRKGQTLGHVFPVCMSWLDESRETLRMIRDFAYERI
jgi:acetyl esterase/lipase